VTPIAKSSGTQYEGEGENMTHFKKMLALLVSCWVIVATVRLSAQESKTSVQNSHPDDLVERAAKTTPSVNKGLYHY